MFSKQLNILLADDDIDDCIFFEEALMGYSTSTTLTKIADGEQLMLYLTDKTVNLPDVLFLDLNMPRKNGFECLLEIRSSEKLKSLPVIIFSTSYEQAVVKLLYENKAHYFIRKPSAFSHYEKIINKALALTEQSEGDQPKKEDFVITL